MMNSTQVLNTNHDKKEKNVKRYKITIKTKNAPVCASQNAITSNKAEPKKRIRKSHEERLQQQIEKRKSAEIKIILLKKELDNTNRKKRNRGLILMGIVLEQCLKKGIFGNINPGVLNVDWWENQAILLPEKDKTLYKEFLFSILKNEEK